MASLFRAPLFTPRGSPSVSRVPHEAQADVTANRLLLLGKDTFFGPPGLAPDYDWPNPLRRDTRFPLENRSFVDPTEFWLYKPTIAQDWPNPGRRLFPIDNRTHADGSETWLLPFATPAPFALGDWPNPFPKLLASSLRTHLASLSLLGLDQFFGAAGQPPSFDWPNPRLAVPSLSSRTHLGWMAFWSPFVQSDWPNPSIARRSLDLLTEADGTEYWLLVTTAAPFAQTDWPDPRGPLYPSSLRTFTQDLYRLAGRDTFFGAPGQPPTVAWPNPSLKAFPLENRTQVDGTEFWLLVSSASPFAQADWPNPSLRKAALAARTHLSWMAFHRAFSQRDWPNPRIKKGGLQEWVLSLIPTVLTPPTVRPFGQRDWLNPRRPAPLSVAQQPWSRFQLESAPTAALDAACVIQVGPDAWVLAVPADPRQTAIAPDPKGVRVTGEPTQIEVDAEPRIVDVEDD